VIRLGSTRYGFQFCIRTCGFTMNRFVSCQLLIVQGLQFGWPSVLHWFQLCCLQFGWHASKSSLQNTVPWHRAVSSQHYLLDLPVHLNAATLFDNTNEGVNVIQALLWLEAWMEFKHSSKVTNQHFFSPSTKKTQPQSPTSIHCVRVGHWLILWMTMGRKHMKSDG